MSSYEKHNKINPRKVRKGYDKQGVKTNEIECSYNKENLLES